MPKPSIRSGGNATFGAPVEPAVLWRGGVGVGGGDVGASVGEGVATADFGVPVAVGEGVGVGITSACFLCFALPDALGVALALAAAFNADETVAVGRGVLIFGGVADA